MLSIFSSVSGSWKGEKEAKKKNSSLKPWDILQLYFWSSVIVCVCVCVLNQIAFLISGTKSICSEMVCYLISAAGLYKVPKL